MTSSGKLAGVVVGDPTKDLPVGSHLAIQAVPHPAGMLQQAQNWTHFDGVLLKILFESGGQRRVHGSGVMVGPGVALCARHVVEPEIEEVLAGRARMGALALTHHGLALWTVHQIHVWDPSDVVIVMLRLQTELPSNRTFKHAFITTRLAPLGEVVSAVGFVAEREAFDVEAGIQGRVHVAQGRVLEHVLGGRPGLGGPSMWVSVGAPGGMSGGPVFDQAGALVGILSKAIGDDGDGLSAVSLLPQALVQPMTPAWPEGLQCGETCLRDFAKLLNSIERPEAIDFTQNAAGERTLLWDTWN